MIRYAAIFALLLAWPLAAQDDGGGFTMTPELDLELEEDLGVVETSESKRAATAGAALLRGLDRVSGVTTDLQLSTGQTTRFGRLQVTLGECRYPEANPSSDAFAYLVVRPEDDPQPVFEGWMIASSPALNALDHPRYDVWVLRCITS